jgi:hypothetical protein
MTMKTTETSLKNGTNSLPTLASGSTRGAFPANYWGYSVDDTAAGSAASNYAALVPSNASTPITILTSNTSSGNRTFYFGAKGNSSTPSGTYTGTVVVSVVSGAIGPSNPITPTNPVTPNVYDFPVYQTSPAGGSSSGATYYATRSGNTTTTEVTAGDNRCNQYGVCNPVAMGELYDTYAKISNGSMLATALAVTAATAATSGIFFFVLAKRDDDDDDDEDEEL